MSAPSPTDLRRRPRRGDLRVRVQRLPRSPSAMARPPKGSNPPARSPEASCAGTPAARPPTTPSTHRLGGSRPRDRARQHHAPSAPTQLEWLKAQLAAAKGRQQPAIVIGNASLPAEVAAGERTGTEVAQALVEGGASALLLRLARTEPAARAQARAANGQQGELPTFGSGTLGYVSYAAQAQEDFIGASGFLLDAGRTWRRATKSTNVAPVSVRLIPNIGELALEAEGGTLLRRSQAALFDGSRRRPRSGNVSHNDSIDAGNRPLHPDPRELRRDRPVPAACSPNTPSAPHGPTSATSSSRTSHPPTRWPSPTAPKASRSPTPHSGLFCAYNAGTTIVTISAGGLSSSLPVTVQAGSVRQPCGTTKLKELPENKAPVGSPPPPVAPAAAPAAAPASAPPPVPPPPATPTPVDAHAGAW